jgi:hypothetical protein
VNLCVVDGSGEIQAEGQAGSDAEWIDALLRKLRLPITPVGPLAGMLIQYRSHGLREIGYPEKILMAT